MFETLSDLRFDDDALEIDREDYYSEELADPTPLIESVLSTYADQVMQAFREGRLANAMMIYLGVYEGTRAATEPADDEYGTIDDYPEQTWEVWHDLLANAHVQLSSRVFHSDQIHQALGLIAERVTAFDRAEPDNGDDDFYDEQAEPIYYNLKSFEPLLLALVTDEPSARLVQEAIRTHNWQNRGTEYVQLRIADKLSDPDLWLQIADAFADQDPTIADWLLQRRLQMGNLPVLIQTLHRLTKLFPKTFNNFILVNLDDTTLTPGPDLNLYLTALENRCRSAGQLTDYLKLRGYWTPAQRRRFADSIASSYGLPLFYAQVLQAEDRDHDLLTWLGTLSWPFTGSLPDILPLVAQTYPNECMDMLTERATNLLSSGQRSRDLYRAIAGWLAALNTIQSLKPQVAIFVGHLLSDYKRLIALKDELRMKGLTR